MKYTKTILLDYKIEDHGYLPDDELQKEWNKRYAIVTYDLSDDSWVLDEYGVYSTANDKTVFKSIKLNVFSPTYNKVCKYIEVMYLSDEESFIKIENIV